MAAGPRSDDASGAVERQKPAHRPRLICPPRTSGFDARSLAIAAPGKRELLVRDINFALKAGDVLAIVGASGAGKSSLARTLIGVWPPAGGALNSTAPISTNGPESWAGQHGGYLSQSADFIEGTSPRSFHAIAGRQ